MAVNRVVRGGTIYDGSGGPGRQADVLIVDDRIVAIEPAPMEPLDADVIDATGLAVTPGFINALSHAWGSLQLDSSAASEIYQGVTTEVFGEAFSLGPSNDAFAELVQDSVLAADVRVVFDRLSEGLDFLERKGVAPNVASFIGGDNLRMLTAGFADRPLEPREIDLLRGLIAEDMQDGALGIGTALIYPPGCFAGTDELAALCSVVGEYDGMYISHLRGEGDTFLDALDELIAIGQRANVRTEAYHLKAAGRANWPKMQQAIDRIEQARAAGQHVSADMYPYVAGATGLVACIPPWYQAGGPNALRERLADPGERARMTKDIQQPSEAWENLYLGAGGGSGILFFADLVDGTPATGRWLSEVADTLGMAEIDALLEIVAQDQTVGVAYFEMSEDNVRLGLQQPWVSVGSDAQAHKSEAPWVEQATHPRTYGTFARFLGHYGRDEELFSLSEGVRRMTSLPADNFGLRDRGRVAVGHYADIAVFDPNQFVDTATFTDPHQYAVGMRHVLVNGVPVLRDGALTGATAGRRLGRAR